MPSRFTHLTSTLAESCDLLVQFRAKPRGCISRKLSFGPFVGFVGTKIGYGKEIQRPANNKDVHIFVSVSPSRAHQKFCTHHPITLPPVVAKAHHPLPRPAYGRLLSLTLCFVFLFTNLPFSPPSFLRSVYGIGMPINGRKHVFQASIK